MNTKLQNPRSLSFLDGFSRFKEQNNQQGKLYTKHSIISRNERFESLLVFEEKSETVLFWWFNGETDALWSSK